MAEGPRYAFIVTWVDPVSGVVWKYQLLYYVDTHEIEMFDVKNRRAFLKRSKYEQLKPELLYLGATIVVHARQLKIVEYGDSFTEKELSSRQERTLAMIKPDAVKHLGKIVDMIQQSGLTISRMRMCQLSKAEARQFYAVHEGKPSFEPLTEFMSSGRIVAAELMGLGAIQRWRELIGPTSSEQARSDAPESLRARFGTDNTRNACHGSDGSDTAAAEAAFFFSPGAKPGAGCQGAQSTLGIIKPHCVRSGDLGDCDAADTAAARRATGASGAMVGAVAVLQRQMCFAGTSGHVLNSVLSVFDITALELFNIEKANAAEFYEVYRGVVAPNEYSGMVEELVSGPFVALEVVDPHGADPVEAFRELCGPAEPELARVLRPHTLRAKFGANKVRNAMHCTDLPEDGQLEVNYFFQILQSVH